MYGYRKRSLAPRPPLLPARMPAVGESESVANLRELVSHPHVVEILDVLRHGPMTFAGMRTHVHAGRRALVVALRLVAARGLVTRNDSGSWDSDVPVDVVYRHTDVGRRVVETLSRFSMWTTIIPESGSPSPPRSVGAPGATGRLRACAATAPGTRADSGSPWRRPGPRLP
jgi:DNA-binding HxlR family transcriptional regulator